jgi:hypothetical protein
VTTSYEIVIISLDLIFQEHFLCCLLTRSHGNWGQALLFDILQQLLFYSKVNEVFLLAFIDARCTAYASDGMDS